MKHLFPSVLFGLSAIACSTEEEKTNDTVVVEAVLEEADENNAPSQPVLAIGPTQPGTDDALTATIVQQSIDPEGEDVSLTWTWTKDGTVVDGADGPEISAEQTEPGQQWTVYAIPSDGTQEGMAGSASVVIADSSGSETSEENVAPTAPIVSMADEQAPTTRSMSIANQTSTSYRNCFHY